MYFVMLFVEDILVFGMAVFQSQSLLITCNMLMEVVLVYLYYSVLLHMCNVYQVQYIYVTQIDHTVDLRSVFFSPLLALLKGTISLSSVCQSVCPVFWDFLCVG
jgi:hypothetical protein